MAKKSKKLKLPKKFAGVKLPKQPRRSLNALLKNVPHAQANPIVAMAVGAVATALAERLEQPLRDLLRSRGLEPKPAKGKHRDKRVPATSVATH